MVISKQIKDWDKILLDTTLLCALFRSEDSPHVDEQTAFGVKLISYLSKNKTSGSKERTFYVSAVTLSELLTRENNSDKIKRILKVLNSRNVEFIDFDLDTALQFNAQLHPYLSKESLHAMAAQIGFKTGDYMMAREWITRDYMIIMSGVSRNADIVLSADKNTFYPLCKHVNRLDCVLAYPELFEQSEQYILKYHDDKVDDFLKPKPKPIEKPTMPTPKEELTKVSSSNEPQQPS